MLREYSFQALTDWDRQVFDTVVPSDHFLRLALRLIPWQEISESLAGYYTAEMGRPALTPLRMLKLEYLRYHYNLSDRDVVVRAETDLAFRLFLQLPLAHPLPHSSSLCYFRGRLGLEGFKMIFDRVVGSAREHGFVKDRLRIKDATHVIGNMAIPTALALVAQTRDKLLDAAEPFAEVMGAGERVNLELMRATTQSLAPAERLVTRLDYLRELLVWIDEIESPANADKKQWQRFLNQRDLAHKILSDQEQPGASDQTISTTDLDARRGRHGDFYNGYLVDIIIDADSEIITQLNVLPANGNEGFDAIELLEREEAAHGNDVQAISIDGAGFSGPLLRSLQDPAGLNVEAFVPVPTGRADKRFAHDDFSYDPQSETMTCPAGKTSKTGSHSDIKQTTRYRFSVSDCRACPLLECCMKTSPKTCGRTVCKSEYQSEHEQAKQKTSTQAYQQIRREHPKIERKLGEMMNRHGGRHAKYFGQAKVTIQETMAGLATNIKRMVKLHCAPIPSPNAI
jgi:transposase